MSRRRHHERHGHYGVHVRWHEYRRTTGDVKTSVVRRGMNMALGKHSCKILTFPYRDFSKYGRCYPDDTP